MKKEEENEIQIEEEGEELKDKLKKVKDKLKKCQQEKDEYLAGWQRAKADFINARKDEEKRRETFLKLANKILISEILIVLDSFDLALKNSDDKGFFLIKNQLNEILKKYGLEEIKTIGEKFDPKFHESIEELESDEESGIIVEEARKGYMLNGEVIRASKVKIAK